jgi:hypothetical protein
MNEERPSDETVPGPDPEVVEGSSGRSADDPGLVRTASGLARIYASAWWNTAEWTVETSLHTASRLIRAAISGERPGALVEETVAEMRDYARRLLEIVDTNGRVPSAVSDLVRDAEGHPPTSQQSLRERGEELLRRSADVSYEEDTHPAYERILADLAPDEARILRLLTTRGPQPSIDIRAGFPLVSQLVAPGRSMIGAEAGCRHTDRVPAYLNNLSRLGLVWFSREPVKDPHRYQVLEAQPDVLDSMRKGGRTARTVRRSIVLTPFGKDFCDVCLPVDTGEFEALTGDGDGLSRAPEAESQASSEG